MLPNGTHSLLYTLAVAAAALIGHEDTPRLIRQEISDFIQNLRKKLPAEAQAEIEAAEAEAVIKALGYLRRDDPGS